MNSQLDERFSLVRASLSSGDLMISNRVGVEREIEAFFAISQVCNIPVQIVHVKVGDKDSLPVSVKGKTSIKFVGEAPMVSVEPDRNKNMKMLFTGPSAIEVIYNSERPQAHGKNRGAHGNKKIYLVEK